MGAYFVGNVGILRFSYCTAIELRSWKLERHDEILGGETTLLAKARVINEFWVRKDSFELFLNMGSDWWRFPECRLTDIPTLGHVEAIVRGDPEVVNGGMEWAEYIGS